MVCAEGSGRVVWQIVFRPHGAQSRSDRLLWFILIVQPHLRHRFLSY